MRAEQNGFIVPIRDAETIVDRLTRLLDQPALRQQMGHSARSRAKGFDTAGYGRRLVAALEKGLGQGPGVNAQTIDSLHASKANCVPGGV